MPLPKIVTSQYELILPSSGKPIKYRPFLVKEEKILLEASESKNKNQIINAIKQIIKNCILTRGIKIEELPSFDIEYIFLNARAKSVGENLDLIVTCEDDGETQVPVTIFIDEIKVETDPEHSKDIDLGNNTILRMKYPSLKQFVENSFTFGSEEVGEEDEIKLSKMENVNKSFKIISSCMDVIFNEKDSYAASDCTEKELFEFLDGLTNSQFKMIEKFFDTMPILKHTFIVKNPKTGVENIVTLQGLTSFFIL
jgi:hypothetical protein